ncbi:regulatory protein RecX [Bowmanella yangjiangensis]|uniref:Regulatory protein RecX n=1 Tax=Bowmanella yangjiangensis TaxID=2811230 RepID=A0ABS3CYJ7_9ALTE|nr:regulatory protein RecX [Bowmanella yangjiangensis]MBN7822199.1 regulatory protein RecX [Bowmanella yangjiangensis]
MTDADRKIIRETLTMLLARREHSQAELMVKLTAREFDPSLSRTILTEFAERGWQSDARFAGCFVRQRVGKGQGEARIRAELRMRQVADCHIQQALDELDVDWFAAALTAYQRKYRQPAADWKEQQKRMRYLQYKGFNGEQIRFACESAFIDE